MQDGHLLLSNGKNPAACLNGRVPRAMLPAKALMCSYGHALGGTCVGAYVPPFVARLLLLTVSEFCGSETVF